MLKYEATTDESTDCSPTPQAALGAVLARRPGSRDKFNTPATGEGEQ